MTADVSCFKYRDFPSEILFPLVLAEKAYLPEMNGGGERFQAWPDAIADSITDNTCLGLTAYPLSMVQGNLIIQGFFYKAEHILFIHTGTAQLPAA